MKQGRISLLSLIIIGIIALVCIAVIGFSIAWVRSLSFENIIASDFVTEQIVEVVGEQQRPLVELLPTLLGLQEPQTYLLLFLNNTELRPGGGFLGSYAVVTISRGEPDIVVLEGSEGLDKRTPKQWRPEPPAILKEELGVDHWYFRDSNWSPDFIASTEKTLELYRAEGGAAADDIDAVIGVTPTVLEAILKIIGPVTVKGITFTEENVTETLEYEVEYGYQDRDIAFEQRKAFIQTFFHVIAEKIGDDLLNRPDLYLHEIERLLQEKHILVSGMNESFQTLAEERDWTGQVRQNVFGDYLLWVDANLAALKTDHAIKRTLRYGLGVAEMTYTHSGEIDWRTTRYRTYARVYVPEGSALRSVYSIDHAEKKQIDIKMIDSGVELGKQWFGVFFFIEPGETRTLGFEYTLPHVVAEQIERGEYTLAVQKQLGTISHALTIDLPFTKSVLAATPAEEKVNWGDARYEFQTDLRTDREFHVSF